MSAALDSQAWHYRLVPGQAAAPPLLLLHGTGGSEDDLIPLAQAVAPGRTLLSPRGRVLERGMPRFFARLAEGVFDHDDVRRRADELAGFVARMRAEHGLAAPVALGFSNGANMAAALLLRQPDALAGAVLLRAVLPLPDPVAAGSLTGKPVLLMSGAADPMAPANQAAALAATLRDAGAEVRHVTVPGGHGLSETDMGAMRSWLAVPARP